MVASAISAPSNCSTIFRNRPSSTSLFSHINSRKTIISALPSNSNDSSTNGLLNKQHPFRLRMDEKDSRAVTNPSYGPVISNREGPIMPAVMTPGGPLDVSTVLFRNRVIFIGQPIYAEVAQQVISQLVTLATVDENADILLYLNCPGGSLYSVLAIYDCMSWIKPKVGTVSFGFTSNQAALILAGGEKGMRYAMPNARIMIHQPQTQCGVTPNCIVLDICAQHQVAHVLWANGNGHVEDVKRQIRESIQSRHKIDHMLATFTGQPLDTVQQYTERECYMSAGEAMEFGLIDGILETEI